MHKTVKLLLSFVVILAAARWVVSPVMAIADPPLFNCNGPVGSIIADFNDGNHGIAGDTDTHSGTDQVFQVDTDHVLQCFCADNGSGIQSNWWKVSGLSQDDIDFFVRRGWVLISNGQPWGLEDAPYLVKNDSLSCHDEGGSFSSSSGSSSSSNSTSNSSTPEAGSSASPLQGQVLGASTLAFTGNQEIILIYFTVGLGFALVAYRLARH